jgi:glyceraldehyde 3-phosphate dehydrogenase (phosphorylating)
MSVRVGINGFGRSGRGVLRCAQERDLDLEIVAVNDVADACTLAALLARDSVYGRFPGQVRVAKDSIRIELAERVLAPVRA